MESNWSPIGKAVLHLIFFMTSLMYYICKPRSCWDGSGAKSGQGGGAFGGGRRTKTVLPAAGPRCQSSSACSNTCGPTAAKLASLRRPSCISESATGGVKTGQCPAPRTISRQRARVGSRQLWFSGRNIQRIGVHRPPGLAYLCKSVRTTERLGL
jgi:hypothetical protein